MVITATGISIAAGGPRGMVATVVVGLILQFYVIAREEHYLEHKFGKEYTDYKDMVRRWI